MTDGGAPFQPGPDGVTVPVRPRSDYAGYRAFGSGDGAVLIAPPVAHDLRSAAKLATARRRIAGGLLYGCGWTDELGTYLVIDYFLEARAAENGGGVVAGEGDPAAGEGDGHGGREGDGDDHGDFTLSEAGLRRLREDAARMHPDALEAGWWRTCAALGEFGPRDFVTQGELVGPDGVGLLVYGSGSYWGTAYLGPDGHAPDSAGTLAVAADPAADLDTEPLPGPGPAVAAEAGIAPEPGVTDTGTSESLAEEPPLIGTAARPRRVRRRMAASGYGPPRYGLPRRRRARLTDEDALEPGAELPADVQLVVGALMAVIIAAAIIIGFIVSSLVVAVIIGAVGLVVVASAVWLSRHY